MKDLSTREQFIKLRAEGKSYRAIASELCIAKTTAQSWGREYESEISRLKEEQLQGLYEQYHMSKEGRIKALGGTLERINGALAKKQLESVEPEKLLALKLKYIAALQKEYTAPNAEPLGKEITPTAILEAYRGLYNRVLTGQITEEQATREGAILSDILKVCEAQALQDKIDLLQRTLGGR